ncbi:Slk19p KNAG_0A03360 [Huiozyma naganishii CBS 8797]|uniref:Uncharacterized protein n=1 Tax=Huiozyma naganishii (strain ATCC MYA-139 / BCRC 22969 / CBS 8797 / KCTC 17520 / NBRC 10181 / NCYC 3082 / Yp74L-3) TaxID=1071383 RepID=J7S3K2_HUIN7|nr:hypothetical protein KNAG_0A03360 [Kazachstania naganishii CBS 8797]CCK68021.1 hypothetical protein KNAG_0A03360 [Kazachstania naganishii CBS 8797]
MEGGEFPTTPIKQMPAQEGHMLSLVNSPPILEEQTLDTHSNNISLGDGTEDIPSHLRTHPHGLSSKKRSYSSRDREFASSAGVQEHLVFNDSDRPIEVGRNTVVVNEHGNSNSSSPDNILSGTNNNLEQANVNMLYSKRSPTKMIINSSEPAEFKTSPDKKIKLEKTPRLNQSDGENGANNIESPKIIEMLDPESSAPPPKIKREETNEEEEKDDFANGKEHEDSGKLTPISHYDSIDFEMTADTTMGIDTVGKRNEQLTDELYHLNQKMNSTILHNDKLKMEVKQLISKVDSLVKEKNKLSTDAEGATKLRDENESLKTSIGELKTELSMLDSNQTLLQEKYDQIYSEYEKSQSTTDFMKKEIESLQKSLEDSANILEELSEHSKELESKLSTVEQEKKNMEEEKLKLLKENKHVMNQLSGKDNEIVSLEGKIKDLVNSERNHSKSLIDQIAVLTNEKMSLEEQVKKSENQFQSEISELQDTLKEKESELLDTTRALNDAKEDNTKLINEMMDRTKEVQSLKKTYEEANDHASVRTAEVTELNNQIETLKESQRHLETTIDLLQEKIGTWKSKYEDQIEKERELNLEIETLNARVKDEEHSSTGDAPNSAELHQMRKEKEELQKKLSDSVKRIELMTAETSKTSPNEDSDESKQMIASLKAQFSALKRRSESREVEFNKKLKKLSEDLYVQYSSKHEQKVKLLKQTYENKYKGEIEKLKNENNGLTQEMEQINSKLTLERAEKQELLRVLDQSGK